ncbi:MAG: SIS domain-containing protein [Prolixibacteraceae bacterium]|jgi:arabinose-5-phosphate isomerase|nr:SIS domain-containing protein [Prolixibacteraceae bacterium]
MINEVKSVFAREAEAIKNIPVDENFEKAIGLIYTHVHENGGKLVASGMGKAGQIAQNIATTFSSTGTPSVFLHPSDAQHGDLGILAANDVLLLISNSGRTCEIVELVLLMRRLYPQIPFVLITGNKDGELVKTASAVLLTGNPEEVCPLGLTPSTSTTVMTVIGDALVVTMMKRIGFTSADYSKRHHGGYLGEKSRGLFAI